MDVKWLDQPEAHDYDATADYLSLIGEHEIADGYHRVCASYLTDENTPIPCRLVFWQT